MLHDRNQSFVRWARKCSLLKVLLDEYPKKLIFSDGKARTTRRAICRMFTLWRKTGSWEVNESYKYYEGGDILDIGAFQGFYSLHLAPKSKEGDKIVSIEPDANAVPELSRNLSEASLLFPKISFYQLQAPVGDGLPCKVDYKHETGAHPTFESSEISQSVGVMSIVADAVVLALGLRPTFVKIDVEGAELSVVRGLESTLRKFRPTILLEIHPLWQPKDSAIEELVALLTSIGYKKENESKDKYAIRTFWR